MYSYFFFLFNFDVIKELVQSGALAREVHQRSKMGRSCKYTIEPRKFGNSIIVRASKRQSVQTLRGGGGGGGESHGKIQRACCVLFRDFKRR